jgi:hypothetical protein
MLGTGAERCERTRMERPGIDDEVTPYDSRGFADPKLKKWTREC